MNERFLGVCCQLYTLLNLFRVYILTPKQTTKKKKQRNQFHSDWGWTIALISVKALSWPNDNKSLNFWPSARDTQIKHILNFYDSSSVDQDGPLGPGFSVSARSDLCQINQHPQTPRLNLYRWPTLNTHDVMSSISELACWWFSSFWWWDRANRRHTFMEAFVCFLSTHTFRAVTFFEKSSLKQFKSRNPLE